MHREIEGDEFEIDLEFDSDLGIESISEPNKLEAELIGFDANTLTFSSDLEEYDDFTEDDDPKEIDSVEEVTKMLELQSSSKDVISSSDREIIETKRELTRLESERMRLEKTCNYIVEANLESTKEITSTTALSFSTESNIDLAVRVRNKTIDTAPSFLTPAQCTDIRNRLMGITRDDESIESLYNSLKLPSEVRAIKSNRLLFISYVKSMQKELDGVLNEVTRESDNAGHKSQNSAMSLYASQAQSILDFNYNHDKSETRILTSGTLGSGYVDYVCPSCKTLNRFEGVLVSYLPEKNFNEIVTPLKCCECDTYSLLPSDGLTKLKNMLKVRVKLPERSHNYLSMYIPTNSEIIEAFPGLFDVESLEAKEVAEIEVNWDDACEIFRANVRSFYLESKSNTRETMGIKNIAKIVASNLNDYSFLKERATATLLMEFDNSLLNNLSRTYRSTRKIPCYYKDNFEGVEVELAKLGFTDSISDDGEVIEDYTKFKKDLNNYCNSIDNFDEDIENNLKLLLRYYAMFSNLKITNAKLEQNYIDEYLGDPRVASTVDVLTDAMIIANLAEDYMGTFQSRSYSEKTDSTRFDNSYNTRLSNVLDLNKALEIEDKLATFLAFFLDKCDDKKVFLKRSNFFSFYSTEPEFYSTLGKFAKCMLSKDYYEAFKLKEYLVENFELTLKKMGSHDVYVDIVNVLEDIPSIDLSKYDTKYSFYFNEELTEVERVTVMEIFNRRKFAPRELKGDTFKEKKKYYSEVSDTDYKAIKQFPEFFEVQEKNYILLKAISALADSEPEDLSRYMLFRDLLFSFQDLSLHDFCNSLLMNENLVSYTLESEFKYEVSNKVNFSIVRDLIYKNKGLESFFKDDSASLDELRANANLYEKEILEEFRDIPELLKMFKEFLYLDGEGV